jgi:signal transduction histidine kinase/CheY-like chemotaxis protein
MNWAQLLRKSSPYIIMVVIAFVLMGVVGYYSANQVMRKQMEANSGNTLRIAEANIAEGLARSELMLLNAYHSILGMLDRGEGNDAILSYMRDTAEWMGREVNGLPGFYSVYGYINGTLLDGVGFAPAAGYSPESRPWYQTAARLSKGRMAYTAPYADSMTGNMIITAVQNLYGSGGTWYGMLMLDIDLVWFSQYAQVLNLGPASNYGIIISQDMIVITHPDESLMGQNVQDLNDDYAELGRQLAENGTILNRRITDIDGRPAMVSFRQLFNGWYAALVTPMDSYYHNLYNIEINPTFVGLILIILFSLIMLRINAAQIRSDEISAYKSAFLSQMSHEVRTPMNAVIGMSELALRDQDPGRVMEYLGGIKQAGHNLLAIINDILDISRIESGTLQITPAPYYFASLLNDVISMIRAQVAEKPVLFIANVDPTIPNALFGDETRIKQILINLLSNAVKYTREGYIALNVRSASRDGKRIFLTFEIADSGIGIKKEDLSAVFDNFVRLDMVKNRGIEGTGLGLVITRNLCRAMGGEVSVTSEYGKGSVFTASVTQLFEETEGLAMVENSTGKQVLCFEEQEIYAESIIKTLDSLHVPVTRCTTRTEFFRELEHGAYPFAFVSAAIVEEAAEKIKSRYLHTSLAVLANPGELVSWHNIPMLIMPAYVVSIANVLNQRTNFDQQKQRSVHFVVPDARILVVDDIATNVKVAEGLLTLYQPIIHTCYDGHTAVELVKKHHYDLVFLDHMMPGMDGIETVAAIRLLDAPRFRDLPIVAMTANAVFGMKEMFLANGFNDYLAKPIEITKLDAILAKWIPMDKRIRKSPQDIIHSAAQS